ncbi:hypothetical protein FA95DRAFT_1195471 [Auriscalpium vulgare]|uniref:Uncharacterized protein n=1 Tax=Auriscalpium vulgare TaxID=40419 RepID=A0ACB8RU74_9AGAM|nr:hypothetical protein FA95DRAFT_1195471 [Auriscalpium vulgare]
MRYNAFVAAFSPFFARLASACATTPFDSPIPCTCVKAMAALCVKSCLTALPGDHCQDQSSSKRTCRTRPYLTLSNSQSYFGRLKRQRIRRLKPRNPAAGGSMHHPARPMSARVLARWPLARCVKMVTAHCRPSAEKSSNSSIDATRLGQAFLSYRSFRCMLQGR